MPDQAGLLSEAEKKDITQKLQRLWMGSQICPICGSNNWTIADHVVAPLSLGGGGGLTVGGPSYPLILLISQPCGYTIAFNALVLGVIPPNPTPSKKEG